MAPKTFGERLKEKRVAARFTQEGLAHAAGSVCTGAYISALERNADVGKSGRPTRPDQTIVDALARALGAPVSEARMYAGYAAPDTLPIPQEEELIEAIRELPPGKQEDLILIVKALLQKYRIHSDPTNTDSE